MATLRELKNKIRSISNTKKITRTMEMISTAKAQVCRRRIEAVQPYGDKLAEILRDLKRAGSEGGAGFPLLRVPEKKRSEVLFVVTANRGLCGGYNANVLKLAERAIDAGKRDGVDVQVHMIGKKGIGRFKYSNRAVAATYTNFDDKSVFADGEAVIEPILARYAAGEIDAVSIAFTHYESSSRQSPLQVQLLPIPEKTDSDSEESSDAHGDINFIFEPSPDAILSTLLPLSLKTQFFQILLEAQTSEQIARRVAMKNATDNAEEMVRNYTQDYNRTRQAGITQEILEIIGGASA